MAQRQPLHAPPSEVMKYLGSAQYPCSKQDLMDLAKRNNAPRDVVRALEIMYSEKFTGPNDVERNLKSSEARDQSATERHEHQQ
jgi:hypothetical protein